MKTSEVCGLSEVTDGLCLEIDISADISATSEIPFTFWSGDTVQIS